MYTNPVIFCDYSDPDVIYANGTYFLVASSFNFTPGLPILASKNLVNWKLVNYALENIPSSRFAYPQNSQGIWAPSFCHHNGKYYIVVGMPDEGIFITESDNILGTWSQMKQVHTSKGFIDPCLFWDDDGKAYIIHAYAKSRCGFNSRIGILDFDEKTFRTTGEDRIIYDGTQTQPTIEGPKVYKRNGWYYIFAPAGGVSEGWQTVLRSKNIEGPYEEKIVLHEGKSGINGPHQGALVETPFGENWFIHFQERGIFGRIVHLQPVKWKDDWPLIGTAVKTGIMPGEPVLRYKSPKYKKNRSENIVTKAVRAFDGASLDWQWNANHDESFGKIYGFPDSNVESFKLNVLNVSSYSKKNFPVLWNSSNVLTQKIQSPNFYFSGNIEVSSLPCYCRTGIIFIGNEYASVAIERTAEGYDLVYLKSKNTDLTDIVREETEIERIHLSITNPSQCIKFKLEFFPFSEFSGTSQFTIKTGTILNRFRWKSDFFTTENGHWVGGRFGVYAIGNTDGSVLFYNIKVRN